MATGRPAEHGVRAVFRHREFRALWSSYVISLLGDQLARVALAVLVFDRTGSPGWTAVAYATTFLPRALGGTLVAGVADRQPRRTVMIVCDVGRAALIALTALPQQPLVMMCVLVALAEVLASPFVAARAACLPDILAGERYVAGSAVMNMTDQAAQVAGFCAAGVAVASIGSRPALVVDAVTFLASALVLRLGVRPHRPVAGGPGRQQGGKLAVGRLLLRDAHLRGLTMLAMLNGLWIVPEALAVPYAAGLHGGPRATGLLLAAAPAGSVLGDILVTRLDHGARLRWLRPLLLLSALPLVACWVHPGLAISFTLWLLSGVGTAYNVVANALFVTAVPARVRGQAFGFVSAGLSGCQGVAIALAGAAAQVAAPALVIALAGVAGAVVVARIRPTWAPAGPPDTVVLPEQTGHQADDPHEQALAT